jgi:hypothetical protein
LLTLTEQVRCCKHVSVRCKAAAVLLCTDGASSLTGTCPIRTLSPRVLSSHQAASQCVDSMAA